MAQPRCDRRQPQPIGRMADRHPKRRCGRGRPRARRLAFSVRRFRPGSPDCPVAERAAIPGRTRWSRSSNLRQKGQRNGPKPPLQTARGSLASRKAEGRRRTSCTLEALLALSARIPTATHWELNLPGSRSEAISGAILHFLNGVAVFGTIMKAAPPLAFPSPEATAIAPPARKQHITAARFRLPPGRSHVR